MKYAEKLKDPRWQRKRLDVFRRDKFCCRACGKGDKPLHIHHREYRRETEPWDYPKSSLLTLCEECHEMIEQAIKLVRWNAQLWGLQFIVPKLVKMSGPWVRSAYDCIVKLEQLEKSKKQTVTRSLPEAMQ